MAEAGCITIFILWYSLEGGIGTLGLPCCYAWVGPNALYESLQLRVGVYVGGLYVGQGEVPREGVVEGDVRPGQL